MTFPASADELTKAGYKGAVGGPDRSAWGKCRGCGARIYWATTPQGKRMPFDELGTDPLMGRIFEPHWGNCAAREQFRKQK